ncbi:MAG TPA: CRISPR-associated endonuclease Cas3'' [Acidobacteriota bacterium]
MSIGLGDFGEFFRAVSDCNPFRWQERLVERVLTARPPQRVWPEAIALPTGSGKTSCLDIAVFALACQAELPLQERTAVRRILFVVDRRVIVDEAFEHALNLAERLDAASNGILWEVAQALRKVNGTTDAPPLTCYQLRGGMYRDDAWARTPTQPCVIASTVDQIGSRLLFRGYGRSFKAWPIHAGLAGNDALIILDEAHCANPFLQTMQAVERYRGERWAREHLGGPFHFTIMSATPPPGINDVLRLDVNEKSEDLRDCEVLRRRVTSSKPTRLIVATEAKGKRALDELTAELVVRAAELVSNSRQRIAILVNRVYTARMIYRLLCAVRDPGDADPDVDWRHIRQLATLLPGEFDAVLLTGRMRSIDRDELMENWAPYASPPNSARGLLIWFGTSSKRPAVPRPAIVVATQCLEVGANLDFDGMVSECASLDALQQRFGRLNRIGRTDCDARGAIVIRADQKDTAVVDPVYGQAIPNTWQWLTEHAVGFDLSEPEIDFGITTISQLVAQVEPEQRSMLVPPSPDAPVLLPAHVDCWVQTSPVPRPDPNLAVFLHGPQRGAPEVQVCWRADLPEHGSVDVKDDLADVEKSRLRDRLRSRAVEAVSLCPPTVLECLPVPLWAFRRWWRSAEEGFRCDAAIADIEAGSTEGEVELHPRPEPIAFGVLWRGPEDSEFLDAQGDNLRPGDTIVLPASLRGWDDFGHIPLRIADVAQIDVADHCYVEARRHAMLRLHRVLVKNWRETAELSEPDEHAELLKLLSDPEAELERREIRDLLRGIAASAQIAEHVRRLITLVVEDTRAKWLPHPFGGVVIRGSQRLPVDRRLEFMQPETYTTEDDSASATTNISLKAHSDGVARRAADFARQCGFGNSIVQSMLVTGHLHDLGKADPRFQAFLHGGNTLRAALASMLYAKSGGLVDDRDARSNAWDASGLPDGFRHEQVSLKIVQDFNQLITGDDIDRDLVLHVIACHHGFCRPLAQVVLDEGAPGIDLRGVFDGLSISQSDRERWIPAHRLSSGAAERFWRLVRRYGWWGLAWLEAIFMLADHRQSEDEAEKNIAQRDPHVKGAVA